MASEATQASMSSLPKMKWDAFYSTWQEGVSLESQLFPRQQRK